MKAMKNYAVGRLRPWLGHLMVSHHIDDRGSSRKAAMAGPSAVRSMRVPREDASV
jgi:hypothetical protein